MTLKEKLVHKRHAKRIADKITLESGWDNPFGKFDSDSVSDLILHVIQSLTEKPEFEMEGGEMIYRSAECYTAAGRRQTKQIWLEIAANLRYGIEDDHTVDRTQYPTERK